MRQDKTIPKLDPNSSQIYLNSKPIPLCVRQISQKAYPHLLHFVFF